MENNHVDEYVAEVMREIVSDTIHLINLTMFSGEEYDLVDLVREAQVYANSCVPVAYANNYEVIVGAIRDNKRLYVGWRPKPSIWNFPTSHKGITQ